MIQGRIYTDISYLVLSRFLPNKLHEKHDTCISLEYLYLVQCMENQMKQHSIYILSRKRNINFFFLDCSISANERAKIIQSYNNYIYFTIF